MQKSIRQALLLKSKSELTRRKEHLLLSTISLVPKWSGSESAIPLERVIEVIEGTVRIGRWHPSGDLKLETAEVADPATSRFNSGPKLQRERIAGQKFEPTLRVRSKVASQCYKCQGIGRFAKECPALRRRRGRTRNSPRKGNPSQRSRSNEAWLNPEL